MNPNILATLDNADLLIRNLRSEYDECLKKREIPPSVLDLTHTICERLRSVLDRLARSYWDTKISPQITEKQRGAAKVYFPISDDLHSFSSMMGRWNCPEMKTAHAALHDYLYNMQPFVDPNFSSLKTLHELANTGKHIDLVPQVEQQKITRIEVKRTGGGSVSYDPRTVTFGSGVWLSGAPVDPSTQRIVPTPGVEEHLEVWVRFLIKGYNVDGFVFCVATSNLVRHIANDMTSRFGL
jgi:hypothetical protein